MKAKRKQAGTLLLAGALCLALLGGCASGGQAETVEGGSGENTENAEQLQTILATDLGVKSDMELNFPCLGLAVEVSESLGQRMDSGEILCQGSESTGDDGIDYAFLWWDVIPEENRGAAFTLDDAGQDALEKWFLSLERVGTIGVFRTELTGELDVLTGGSAHMKLGESADGAYQYYLSIREGADESVAEELRQTALNNVTITDMAPFSGGSAFDEPQADVSSLGQFTTETIAGETVTQDIFQGRKLTLVNLFTTWCTPCVQEIPDLEALSQAMADQGVQVVGVVLDAVDSSGRRDGEAAEKARLLQERTGAAYPFLIPDETNWNGRLAGITSVPETFFVDENGNIVGNTYVGSRDLETWTEIVETELAALEGAA